MAALPHNNTNILYVDYNTGTVDHTLECRYLEPATVEDAMAAVSALLTAVEADLSLITILGARDQGAGSNVSFPVDWDGPATYGSGAGDRQNEASYLSFVGRDPHGHRVLVRIFGDGSVNNRESFRVGAGESALVANAIAVLEAADNCFFTINNEAPYWKQYANLGLSSYWQRKFR